MYESFNLLNSYQQDAVVNDDRFLLVNASVGSGKTTVLVNKVLYLYHEKKVPLKDMVVLTFTNKAAEEIKERILVSDNYNIDRKELSLFGTFHSVGRQLLSNVLPVEELGFTMDFTVIDQNGVEEIFDCIINKHKINVKYRKKLQKRLEDYKSGKPLYGNMKYEDEIEKFIEIYKEEKLKRNVMDFDDLLQIASRLLKTGCFKPSWVIIDEFQDTDSVQLDMIDGMVGGGTHVFAVGDPNQVIYSWRGGSENIFNTFKERYNAVEKTLPVNYRSTANIINAARVFLNDPSSLEGIRDKGAAITVKKHYNTFNEALYLCDVIKRLAAEGTQYKDIAIFYRMQKQSAVFEDVFKSHSIPYQVSVRRTLRDIPSLYWFARLLKSAVNERDTDSMIYILKDDRYGLGMTQKQISTALAPGNVSDIPVLVVKINGFRHWLSGITDNIELENKIYDYFDIDSYISPTSISYNEDKEIILKYLGEMKSYIGLNMYSTIEGIRSFIDYSVLYGRGLLSDTKDSQEDCVKLMTLHASKGLEFKCVFISGANSGVIPLGGRYEDEEEKRLFFVGITRAKDYLEISYHSKPEDFKAVPVPSPFIYMIPEEIIESEELKSRSKRLADLRKEIKCNMDRRLQEQEAGTKSRMAVHSKYGTGYIVSEDDEAYTVEFEGYGEKTFSKMFCPLKIM